MHPSNCVRKTEFQLGIPKDLYSKAVTHHKNSPGIILYGFRGKIGSALLMATWCTYLFSVTKAGLAVQVPHPVHACIWC